jgi:uncharacterized membrane protein
MQTLTILILVAKLCFLAFVLLLVPSLSRADIFFSVMVGPDFRTTADGLSVLRRYRIQVLAVALLAAATGFSAIELAPAAQALVWLGLVAPLLVIAVSLGAFLQARRAVLPHAAKPSGKRAVALSRRSAGLPWWPHLLPFLGLFAVAVFLGAHWDQLPAHFPIHWNASGHPNVWSNRSPLTVFGLLAVGAVLDGIIVVLAFLQRGVRQVRADATEAEARFRKTAEVALLVAEYLVATTFGAAGLLPLLNGGDLLVVVLSGIAVAGVVSISVLLMVYGQGGSRLSPPATAVVGDGTPDACWKWGLFYVNREDPALLVEKRFGVGYTINFGNTKAWLLLAPLVAVPLVSVLLLHHWPGPA